MYKRQGLVGDDGPTHHGVFDLSYLRHMPNMSILAPRNENILQHMLYTAIEHPGPVAIRYPRGKATGCSLDEALGCIPWGQAETLRKGNSIAIFAVGPMVSLALQAADILAENGIDAAVIDPRFIKPLDQQCIMDFAKRVKKLITVEENVLQGGFGSAVLELLSNCNLTGIDVFRLGFPDQFIEHGDRDVLLKAYGLTAENITQVALHMLGQSSMELTKAKVTNL